MDKQKEQKNGLFRRLFGLPDNEISELKQQQALEQNGDPTVPGTDVPGGEEAGVSELEISAAPKSEAETVAARPIDTIPSWEELLNKIIPNPVQEQTVPDTYARPEITLQPVHNGEPVPWEISQTAQAERTEEKEQPSWDFKAEPKAEPETEAEVSGQAPLQSKEPQAEVPQAEAPQAAESCESLETQPYPEISVAQVEAASASDENTDSTLNAVRESAPGKPKLVLVSNSRVESESLDEPPAPNASEPQPAEQSPPGVIEKKPKIKTPLQNEQVIWLLEQAREHTEKGEAGKAEKMLEVAVALECHPDVLLALAKHEASVGNLSKSFEAAAKALEQYPDFTEALELLLRLSRLGHACDVARLASLEPDIAENNVSLGRLCLDHKHQAEALYFFEIAQAKGLDMDEVQAELGQLYRQMGKPEQAVRHYERALQLGESHCAIPLFDLYLENNSLAAAELLSHRYFRGQNDPQINKRLAEINMALGKGLYEHQNVETALEKFYAAMDQGHIEAREWLIKSLQLLADSLTGRDPHKAEEYLEALLEVGGFNRDVALKLVDNYLHLGKNTQAVQLLQSLYEREPGDAAIASRLAESLNAAGEAERSAEILESMAEQGFLDAGGREQLYNYYRSQGRFEDAKRHLEVLYAGDSAELRSGLQSLVWEQLRFMTEQGEIEKAWELCRREINDSPSPDMLGMAMKILSQLIDQLIADNRINEALKELERGRSLGLNVLDLGLREASLYESIGNDRAALKVYEAIAAKAPEVWEKIKELYLKAATREYLAGNLSEARKMLEDAHQKLPNNEEVRRALGVLYQETGQYGLAAALARDSMEETDIQVSTDHLSVLRPHAYRRIRLG